MKKLFIIIIFIGTVAIITGVYYYKEYLQFINASVFQQTTLINVKKGQSFTGFVNYLQEKNANGDIWQWRLFARFEKVASGLKAGEFQIEAGLTPVQMMQKINDNQVVTYQFTIIEGMNWRELKYKLMDDNVLLHTLDDINEAQLLKLLNSDQVLVEGLFLPETYQFVRGDSDIEVLQRAHTALNATLTKYWNQRNPNLPFVDSYELLTMASIVEKETSQAGERGTIAGVFVRRLQKNMRLQTDPTVIYGMGESYDGDIRSKDLITDTPYNTYTRKGLPPTPIAMASEESIAASANPTEGKSLYFVANNRGGHYFSETYFQHQKAVKDYLKGNKL